MSEFSTSPPASFEADIPLPAHSHYHQIDTTMSDFSTSPPASFEAETLLPAHPHYYQTDTTMLDFSTSPQASFEAEIPLPATPLLRPEHPLPPGSDWKQAQLDLFHIRLVFLPDDFRFYELPQALVDTVTNSLSESTRKIYSEWEWEIEPESSLSAELVTALGWKIYKDSAGTQEPPVLRPRILPTRSQSETSGSISSVPTSAPSSPFQLTSSQIIQNTREGLESAVQGEARVEHLMHAFLRQCVRIFYRYYGAGKCTIQVDSHHASFRWDDLRCTNDGTMKWLVKPNDANDGIRAVHCPPMAALEAKAHFTGVPAQHSAELLAIILERLNHYTLGNDSVSAIAAAMPSWMLIAHGVLVAGTEIYFTKLEVTPSYIRWLLEGSEDVREEIKIWATKPQDLVDEAQRISAGITAVSLIGYLHTNWEEECLKSADGQKTDWLNQTNLELSSWVLLKSGLSVSGVFLQKK